jgi:hypothetical protein
MTPLQERARDLLNRRELGDASAEDDVALAFRCGDFDLLKELVSQWQAQDVYFKWQHTESGPLHRAWQEYKSEGIRCPPWPAVVARSKVKCSPRQLSRCRSEIGAGFLPNRPSGRPRKNSGQKKT